MRNLILTLTIALFCMSAHAQVGFGTPTPDPSAEVEIQANDKGILIPRVALTGTTDNTTIATPANSLMVFNTSTVADISPGFYYWYNSKWNRIIMGDDATMPQFFYMPALLFDTSALATSQTKDLYQAYVDQFTGAGAYATKFVRSTSAPAEIPHIPQATDLYYYVTDYDDTVLANLSIDANGLLTYDIIGTGSPYSFITVVFVVK